MCGFDCLAGYITALLLKPGDPADLDLGHHPLASPLSRDRRTSCAFCRLLARHAALGGPGGAQQGVCHGFLTPGGQKMVIIGPMCSIQPSFWSKLRPRRGGCNLLRDITLVDDGELPAATLSRIWSKRPAIRSATCSPHHSMARAGLITPCLPSRLDSWPTIPWRRRRLRPGKAGACWHGGAWTSRQAAEAALQLAIAANGYLNEQAPWSRNQTGGRSPAVPRSLCRSWRPAGNVALLLAPLACPIYAKGFEATRSASTSSAAAGTCWSNCDRGVFLEEGSHLAPS